MKIASILLLLSFAPLSLFGMESESLKKELKTAIKECDMVKKKDCYSKISQQVVLNNLRSCPNNIRNFPDSWRQFKKQCREEALSYFPPSNTVVLDNLDDLGSYDMIIKDFTKVLKNTFKTVVASDSLHQYQARHLCNMTLFGCTMFASGFLIGVYKYGVC
jgi:hypothetical protein